MEVCQYNGSCVGCLTTGSMYVTTFEKELCCVEDLATITTGPMKIVEDVKQCHDYREANLWQATGLLVAACLVLVLLVLCMRKWGKLLCVRLCNRSVAETTEGYTLPEHEIRAEDLCEPVHYDASVFFPIPIEELENANPLGLYADCFWTWLR